MALKYPYTSSNYDTVAELLDIGKFALANPNKPKLAPLEITLAPTPLELQKALGFRVMRDEVEELENVSNCSVERAGRGPRFASGDRCAAPALAARSACGETGTMRVPAARKRLRGNSGADGARSSRASPECAGRRLPGAVRASAPHTHAAYSQYNTAFSPD